MDYRPSSDPPQYNRLLHYLALATVVCTFPLIFMGGLVTSHGAGLSVPDWPNSFGYNMFTFPPSQWVEGVLYEHTHRLAGTLVGLLAILLVAVAWWKEPRRWVRWLSAGILGAVIFQGVLGGLRVVWVNLDLAIVHACVGQAFFCLAALMASVTSPWWLRADAHASPPSPPSRHRAVVRLAAVAVVLLFAQLLAGAVMRHYQAGLAIPDLPLAYGKLLPPTSHAEVEAINHWRSRQPGLHPVSMTQIWVHFAHRVGAVLVTIAIALLIRRIGREHAHQPLLMRQAWILTALILFQLLLGVLVVLLRKPADITSAHVAVGALTLLVTFIIGVRAARLGRAIEQAQPSQPQQAPQSSDTPTGRPATA